MEREYAEIQVRGKSVSVPCLRWHDRTVVINGRWLKIASIHDESFVAGTVVASPEDLIAQMKARGMRADLLTFSQKVYEKEPQFPYHYDWDNAAIASTTSFEAWWTALPQVVRKNVRRAERRGITVRTAVFDDEFARGIKSIYDETPVRQGRRFWHYGKDFETVKRENSSYLDRSEFIGAYAGAELVGFMKFVYVDRVAVMMQILSKVAHYDSRPMNALIAKAVEVCASKHISYLMYSKFTYGNKAESQIAEFKQRNGFVQMNFPRYYVPLTLQGSLAMRLRLYRGVLGLLPSSMISLLSQLRAEALKARFATPGEGAPPAASTSE
jgi:hypothetical protein